MLAGFNQAASAASFLKARRDPILKAPTVFGQAYAGHGTLCMRHYHHITRCVSTEHPSKWPHLGLLPEGNNIVLTHLTGLSTLHMHFSLLYNHVMGRCPNVSLTKNLPQLDSVLSLEDATRSWILPLLLLSTRLNLGSDIRYGKLMRGHAQRWLSAFNFH
jgi:hypothetical protein